MADDLSSVKIPLWANVGVFGAGLVFFSIWKTLRITAWKLGVPIKDLVSQSMLYSGLGVCFLNVIISIAVLLIGSLRFIRFDNVMVSYAQWVGWTFSFAILGTMLAKFLYMNSEWIHSLWWTLILSGIFVVLTSVLTENARYLFFAAHASVFFYSIHALWVYRERSDFHALFIMSVVTIVWMLGFSLPALLGHAALQVISFKVEIWWFVVASWIGQLFVAFYICHKLHEKGADLTEWVHKRHLKIFTTRSTEIGYAGSYLAFLPTTADKSAQADTLESGIGKRKPNVLVVRGGADMGETSTRESMEGSYEEEVFLREEMADSKYSSSASPSSSKRSSASSSQGQPHLREVLGANASTKKN